MQTEFKIRLATDMDCPPIAKVLQQSFIEYKALYTPDGFAATTPDAEQIRARIPEGPVWIAVRDDAVFGTVSAVLKGESVYIRSMAVLPTAQGSGIGSALLQQVEMWAGAQRSTRLFLNTTPFLSSAIRLYERAGFRRTEDGPHDLFGTPLFAMEKIVSQP